MKNNFKTFGININSLNLLYKLFGLNYFCKNFIFNNKLSSLLNIFINLGLIKKDLIVSYIFYIKNNKIKSGSYKGYKLVRGLPIYNQRTKTNARRFKQKRKVCSNKARLLKKLI